MIKLKTLICRGNIISENTIQRVEDISRDDIVVGEHGLSILQDRINGINKKATKWGLTPVKLDIIKEEDVEINNHNGKFNNFKEFKKQYTVKIEGKSPQIPGYEFIAKIEHTDGGNLINVAPNSSIKNLPPEYRDADAKCDICHSNRERLNTFIIKDEKNNQLLTVGSSCLKRFLPIDSVNKVINYAEMLEQLRDLSDLVGNDDEDMGGGGGRRSSFFETKTLIKTLAIAYLSKGFYISKKKAQESPEGEYVQPTAALAADILYYRGNSNYEEPKFIKRAREVEKQGNELGDKVVEWMKGHDFDADADAKPDMANYFHNLSVLSKSESTNVKNLGYLGGLLNSYLMNQESIRKKEISDQNPSNFVGNIGDKISVEATLKYVRGFQTQYGFTTIYGFTDDSGNRYVWFSSNNIGIKEGEKYKITATVKDHKQSDVKYGGHKETILTRAKLKSITGEKINEKIIDIIRECYEELD